MRWITVEYQIADYRGTVDVIAPDDAENSEVFACARRELSKDVPLPLGYESFKIVKDSNERPRGWME